MDVVATTDVERMLVLLLGSSEGNRIRRCRYMLWQKNIIGRMVIICLREAAMGGVESLLLLVALIAGAQ